MKKYDLFANNSMASSPNLFVLSVGTDGEWHHGVSFFFEKERFHGDIESKRETSDSKSYFDLHFTDNNIFLCIYWHFT